MSHQSGVILLVLTVEKYSFYELNADINTSFSQSVIMHYIIQFCKHLPIRLAAWHTNVFRSLHKVPLS